MDPLILLFWTLGCTGAAFHGRLRCICSDCVPGRVLRVGGGTAGVRPEPPPRPSAAGYGKNGDLAVPFWSTKDAGQVPFSFTIGLGQARAAPRRFPLACWLTEAGGRNAANA